MHRFNQGMLRRSSLSARAVHAAMQRFVARHWPDEPMLTANVFEHDARVRSFALAMEAWQTR